MNDPKGVDIVRADSPLVLAVLTIEVDTDSHGWLGHEQAADALQGVIPASAGTPAAVFVRGLLRGCDGRAAHMLGGVLCAASNTTLYARGPGVTTLASYLRSAIAQERAWQAKR